MKTIIFFCLLSIPVIMLSWRSLMNVKSHGFYRFFSWESIVWLFVSNYKFWFIEPFGVRQIFSWILLFIAIYLVIAGVLLLKNIGKPGSNRIDESLFQFEKTTELVDTGIFKYIRHPLYSSLIFLTWGVFLKNPTVPLFLVSVVSSFFLYLTSRFDEKECIVFFGEKYRQYMKRSKMFIPFIF